MCVWLIHIFRQRFLTWKPRTCRVLPLETDDELIYKNEQILSYKFLLFFIVKMFAILLFDFSGVRSWRILGTAVLRRVPFRVPLQLIFEKERRLCSKYGDGDTLCIRKFSIHNYLQIAILEVVSASSNLNLFLILSNSRFNCLLDD